jgi:hypothetical protein
MTHFTILWLGQVISAAVYAIASLLPGSAVLGTVFFDTSINSSPAIYRDAVETISFDSGVTNIVGQINSSGGLVPISGSLEFTEINKFASGSLAIENPTTERILCDSMYFNVTTAPTYTTKIDVYAGTGSINEAVSVRGYGSGSVAIADNYTLASGVASLTGSILGTRGGFILNSNDSTTTVNQINVVTLDGSGSGLVGTYNVNCYRTQ